MESELQTELELPPPDDLIKEVSDEKIRQMLNARASIILSGQDEQAYREYSAFCRSYDKAIYRAWYVTTESPNNLLLGYELTEEIAEGAFGRVFRAKDPDGNEIAIKLLKESVRRKPDMLQSFRRGVRSMRILSNHNVEGMVPYRKASEIPAFAVMDIINGPDLGEAVESQYCKDWTVVLRIAVELANIVREGHQLPERVLHRDIRPQNIMLKDYFTDSDNWRVVVLDFDLSWHMGASEVSVIDQSTASGYLAPEQVERRSSESTRNAAIDSFGLGMTLYYLRTGRKPQYLQHKHDGWSQALMDSIQAFKCKQWCSLPNRYARLIEHSTLDKQSDRLDMSQIEGELEQLKAAFTIPSSVESAELVAEEIAARVAIEASYKYAWNADKNTARIAMLSGVTLDMIPHETQRSIEFVFLWTKTESYTHKEVKKYLKPKFEQAISQLRKDNWVIRGIFISFSSAGFTASKDLDYLRSNLSRVAKKLANVIRLLSFE